MPTKPKMPWACPKCGATDRCGKGQCLANGTCEGLICECWGHYATDSADYKRTEAPDHGQVFDNVCTAAICHHCTWAGTVPRPPKKLAAWERKALEAGWTPPENWDKV